MRQPFPPRALDVPEKPAKRWIWILSSIVLLAVVVLNRVQVPAPAGLDPHVFARINAVINSAVSLLLIAGLFTAKAGKLSICFLISYLLHHLFAGETRFGGAGTIKIVYYVILATHILLAGLSLPFILLTAYRALRADHPRHRQLARRVWPVWFYVSVSGVVVYLLISPYY